MAQKRMLSRSISLSLQVNKLDLRSKFIFTWCIPYLDDYGLIDRNPEIIKAMVFPMTKEIKETDIKRFIEQAEKQELISVHENCLEFTGFSRHQSITENKKTESKFKGVTQNIPEFPKITQSNLIKDRLIKDNKSKVLNPKNVLPEKTKELAHLLFDLIKKQNPDWYVKPNWDVWASDIEKLNRIDNRSYESIEKMIRWVQNDDFWKTNIQSPYKLREKYNTLILKAKPNTVKSDPLLYGKRK